MQNDIYLYSFNSTRYYVHPSTNCKKLTETEPHLTLYGKQLLINHINIHHIKYSFGTRNNMETHLGKTTKVLFIQNEKGYSTLQSMRYKLILRYVFKFRLIVLMLSSSLFYSNPTPSGLLSLQPDPRLNSPSNATILFLNLLF